MHRVFISHAHDDKELVDAFVDKIVQLGSGLSADEIFYSSGGDTGVPSGANINEHVRRQVDEAGLVIAVITPAFERSLFCVAELGAAWSRAGELFPLILPGTSYSQMRGVLAGLEIRRIDAEEGLDELHVRLTKLTSRSVPATTWGKHERAWLRQVNGLAAAAASHNRPRYSGAAVSIGAVGVHRSDGRHHGELFRVNERGQVEHSWIPDDSGSWGWNRWCQFAGSERALDVAAVQDQDDRAFVFILAQNGLVTRHEWSLGSGWSPGRPFGCPFRRPSSSIVASSRARTQIDVFVAAEDGSVRMKWCWQDEWNESGDHDGWHEFVPTGT